MIEEVSRKYVKAKKEHKCMWCFGVIPKGEIYTKATIKDDEGLYTWKNHLKCEKLADDLSMFDNLWSDGLGSDEFMENVQEFLNINLDEDDEDLTLFGEEAVDKVISMFSEGIKSI
ncbi:hypothetical protein [Ilyobacter sp.]|uniref:hypothetical protein n=1 Tax=Ilyobacter sp. TaxID=3100343 RepID=UPI003565BCD9